MTVRENEMMMSKKKNSRSVNTEEALILGNPPPPCLDDHLFNPSLSSSSLSSTDRFDPIKNYPSISSLEIDSKNHHSHQQQQQQQQQQQPMEEVKSSCSIVKGRRSAIKERRRRKSSVKKKRKKKEMMCPSLHSTESTTLVVPADEKRKSSPQSKRLDCRDREFELMPPPGSCHRKSTAPATFNVVQPIDPNEPTYCVCHQVSHGDMIACDMDNCQGGEWFHYSCVGLTPETRFKGKWYCPTCKLLPFIVSKAIALEPEPRAARVQVNGTEEGEASCLL